MQRGAAAAIQECSGGAVRALPGGEISQQAGMGQRRQHISHRSPRTHDPPTLCPPTLLSPRGGLGGADRPHPRHGRAASRAPSWKRGCSKDKGGSRVLYGLMTPPPRQWPCWCHHKGPPCPELGSATASPSQEPCSIPGECAEAGPKPEGESKGREGVRGRGVVPNTHPPRDTTSFTFTL